MGKGKTKQKSIANDLPILAVQAVPEERSIVNLGDAEIVAEYLGINRGDMPYATESNALGTTAFYRAVSIIAGTIAGLPLKVYEKGLDDSREQVASFLDNPQGPYEISRFSWKEMLLIHLVIYNEAYLLHVFNQAGALIGLWPIHPRLISEVKWSGPTKIYTMTDADNKKTIFDASNMTQILGFSTDGLRGTSVIDLFRKAIATSIAGETAAYNSFSNGMMIAGLVSTNQDIEEDESRAIKTSLNSKLQGVRHAGEMVFVNRDLKFSPWTMTAADAQFLESREFQVIEFARMLGVPPHLLGATEKQTSWGTGVAEQNLGLARYTLMGYTGRIEEALKPLLPDNQFCEFDYKGLLQGSPTDEINLLIAQVSAGILTADEARQILNRPALPKDVIPLNGTDQPTDTIS